MRVEDPPGGAGISPRFADVAVPLPLPTALTYAVPPALAPRVLPGVRVHVQVGRRRLVGVVVAVRPEAPAGVEPRPLEGLLDAEPVLSAELLSLAAFVVDYYRAPPGEVLRSMIPSGLSPWGARRVWLTDAGAIAPPRDAEEAAVVAALRGTGRIPVSELQGLVGLADLPGVLARLLADGRLGSAERGRGSARYLAGVELPAGDLAAQLAACGRSEPARQVVELLAALGRPATVSELRTAVGCGAAVVTRLVKLGVLRQFTQIESLSLDRHLLASGAARPEVLTAEQEAAVDVLRRALAARSFRSFLLSGVTGSGKTEVYLRAVELTLEAGRSALLLVPEIALVPALARTLRQRFGGTLAILHSGLSGGERQQEWERIRAGEARLVLGPRSAIFAPLSDLGFIAVDEEHDGSYKQDSVPRYNGRDLALVRAQAVRAVVVVGSATPSLETRFNAQRGKVEELRLTRRIGGAQLPEGQVIDLRQQGIPRRPGEVSFSEPLCAEIHRVLAAGDQVILLRNRRGYAPLLLCRACGEDMRCDACGLPRTLHRREVRLVCHYCGSTRSVPTDCPSCGEKALEAVGAGTERVEETFRELFPGVAAGILDRDTSRRPGGAAAVLERFDRGDLQVLIGTQMVSKGHHFPRVALTAVLLADTYLGFPDFRAVERTYSLLTQLAGRAGRGERPGKVVIQTYHPDHYAIRAALAHDDAAFAAEESRFRRIFQYPPYSRMVQLLMRDSDRERGRDRLRELAERLQADPEAKGVRIAGPAPAPFERLQGQWRHQLLLRSTSGARLRRLLARVVPLNPPYDLVVDVDPYQLL